MSIDVSYKGRSLGSIKMIFGSDKNIFVAHGPVCLETLLRLGPAEPVVVEIAGEMTGARFKEVYWKNIGASYSSVEDWVAESLRVA